MKVSIVGAGPTGLVVSAALARRGHRVDLIDRDAGPGANGAWPRKGVMQFHHAHAVRKQVTRTLLAELPEAHERWLALGAEPVYVDTPGGKMHVGTRSRRETLERAIRAAVEHVPGVVFRIAHVAGVTSANDRATGLRFDDGSIDADLVIDASGRSSRVTAALPPADGCGAACGMAYVGRQYQLNPGAEPGPLLNPLAWQADLDGATILVFPHERGIFSVIFARDTTRPELAELRHDQVFDAVAATIPGLAEWTDPARSRPITPVLAGGQLRNHYRSQRTPEGRVRLPGLVSIGDAVCTTTPVYGRGLATSMMQVDHLLSLLDDGADPISDPVGFGAAFDDWCQAHMRPWTEDHMALDVAQSARWRGEDLDLTRPLTTDRILAAGAVDPQIQMASQPYLSMDAGPEIMRALEARARSVYDTGWRAPLSDGPDRADIATTIQRAREEPII